MMVRAMMGTPNGHIPDFVGKGSLLFLVLRVSVLCAACLVVIVKGKSSESERKVYTLDEHVTKHGWPLAAYTTLQFSILQYRINCAANCFL